METRDTVVLDRQAQRRMELLNRLLEDVVSVDQVATALGLSVRHVKRLLAAYRHSGAATLVHGNTGRTPVNRIGDGRRAQLVELAEGRYAGFNRAHLADVLAEEEEIEVPERTLRRILSEEGIPATRARRARHRYRRRERMARAGMLLQVDGSRHDWLQGRGPWLTLVGGIDDATGGVTGARFGVQEDAAGYFALLLATLSGHGLPLSIYSDRHGIFWRDRMRPPTLAEQLTGQRSLTHVGRALEDAGIGWIAARSAQAKGRVERLWGTLQDRLVSELRLAGADTLESANAVLAGYLPRHNRRFAVPPAEAEPVWRAWAGPRPAEAVFCFRYERRVTNDGTVSWAGERLGLPSRDDGRSWAGARIVVQERIDGSLWAEHRERQYRLEVAPADPARLRARSNPSRLTTTTDLPPGLLVAHRPAPPAPSSALTAHVPAADHPWRHYKRRG
jgi:transposase